MSAQSEFLDERVGRAAPATDTLSGNTSKPLSEELLHFSAKPLVGITSAKQEVEPDRKPTGLWVSVGDAWAEWCRGESFALEHFNHVARIRLADHANILRLTDAADIDAFTERYGGPQPWQQREYVQRRQWDIAWARVAEDFDGIVIAPYVYTRRHELMWYYGWDCASGCIWSARAVASFESVDLAAIADTPTDPPSLATDDTP